MLKPQTSPTRELVNLDGLWRFAVDPGTPHTLWQAPLDTTLEAAVPASYNDLFADAAIRDHVGWVWYQRTVRVPRGWAGERVFVRLDAATHEGVVYVNDTKVAEHVGGYTPFEADITELVTAGPGVPPHGRRQQRAHQHHDPAGQHHRHRRTAAASRSTCTTSTTTRASPARCGSTARPPCASTTSRSRPTSTARPGSSASTSRRPAPTPFG